MTHRHLLTATAATLAAGGRLESDPGGDGGYHVRAWLPVEAGA